MSSSPYFPTAGLEKDFSLQVKNHLQPKKTHQQHGHRDCYTPTDFSPADSKILTDLVLFTPTPTVASLPTMFNSPTLSPAGGLVAPEPIYAEPPPTKPPPTIPPLTATPAYTPPMPSTATTNTPLPVAIAENSSPATTNTPWPAVGGNSHPPSPTVRSTITTTLPLPTVAVAESPQPVGDGNSLPIPVDDSPPPAAVRGNSPPHDAANNGQKRGYVDAFESVPLGRKYKRIELRVPRMFPQAAIEQVLHHQSYAELLYAVATESTRGNIAFKGALIICHYAELLRCQSPLCDKPSQVLPNGTLDSKCRCCNKEATVDTSPKEPSDGDQHCTKVFTKAQWDDAGLLKKILKDPSIERFKRLQERLKKHCFKSDGIVNPLGLKNVLREELNRQNDQICSRDLIGFNFAPLLVKIFADALELKEGDDYTLDEMESLVNKIVLNENTKMTFNHGKEKGSFDGHYWQLYWSARCFLDLVEGSLAYGLVDCLVNLLVCEGLDGTKNSVLIGVWAATGFLLSTISRCAAFQAKDVALPTFIKDQGSVTSRSDRSATGPLIIATKIRLLKELIRCACSVGFNPTPLFSNEGKLYCDDFEKLLCGDEVSELDSNVYFLSLFKGIGRNDKRPMAVIAQSICECVWSETENCLLIFPACLAACVGMLLKSVVYQNSNGNGGPYKNPLLKDSRGKSIKFCNGLKRSQNSTIAEMATHVSAASFDDFSFFRRGVITDIYYIFSRILDFNTTVEHMTAIGKEDIPDVEDNAVFSLNYNEYTDVLHGGSTLAEKEKLIQSWTVALQLHKQRSNMKAATNEEASNEYVRKNPDYIRDTVAMVLHEIKDPEFDNFVENYVGKDVETVEKKDITTVENVTN